MKYGRKESLPTHCDRVSDYWATLVCFSEFASGKARSQRYKAVRAFKAGLNMPEEAKHQVFMDTLELTRLKARAT